MSQPKPDSSRATKAHAAGQASTQIFKPSSRTNLYANYGRDVQQLYERNKNIPLSRLDVIERAGSVLVTFNREGTVLSLIVEQSTGPPSLDEQAIKMVQKSLVALPLPKQLRGQVLTLSVPKSFKLDG